MLTILRLEDRPEVTAPEFAHGVHVLEGDKRDVDKGRLLTQAARAR